MNRVQLITLSIISLMGYSIPCKSIQKYFIPNKNITIVVERADITSCRVDVIVNAANPQLLAGGGVCGAIFAAAGLAELQKACNFFPAQGADATRCPVGQAVITDSFNLHLCGIQYIIHAVGPDCRVIKDTKKQDLLLEQSYINSLNVADKKQLQSIAFPFISSAIYAFPKKRASDIAVRTVVDYLEKQPTTLKSVHFVLFSQEDYDLFCKAMQDKLSGTVAQESYITYFKKLFS